MYVLHLIEIIGRGAGSNLGQGGGAAFEEGHIMTYVIFVCLVFQLFLRKRQVSTWEKLNNILNLKFVKRQIFKRLFKVSWFIQKECTIYKVYFLEIGYYSNKENKLMNYDFKRMYLLKWKTTKKTSSTRLTSRERENKLREKKTKYKIKNMCFSVKNQKD